MTLWVGLFVFASVPAPAFVGRVEGWEPLALWLLRIPSPFATEILHMRTPASEGLRAARSGRSAALRRITTRSAAARTLRQALSSLDSVAARPIRSSLAVLSLTPPCACLRVVSQLGRYVTRSFAASTPSDLPGIVY